MELNGEETDEADEEARECGWVENVTEEPLDVDMLGRRKAQQSGDLTGDSHEKRVGGDSMEGEKVMVRELDRGSRIIGGSMVIEGGICLPSLAGVLEVVLETTPLVPLESAVPKDKKDDDNDDDNGPNLGHLDNVATEIVNHRGINLITETDGGLLRNGEDGWFEGNIIEGTGNLLLCQLEGSVEAR